MAIFDFLKDVGKKILSGGAQNHSVQNAVSPAMGGSIAEQLKAHLEKMNLGLSGTDVKVDGDKVTLIGSGPQAAMEKAVLALGNIEGISKVEAPLEMNAAQGPNFYTVKKGDTLSKIAKEHYGNANRYYEIFEANRPMLKDQDEIYPGQMLRIPHADERKAA